MSDSSLTAVTDGSKNIKMFPIGFLFKKNKQTRGNRRGCIVFGIGYPRHRKSLHWCVLN